jgi:GNAT superfamily N-acetyltransferase
VSGAGYQIAVVAEPDLAALLALMRAYCDFYDTAPGDGDLLALARALIVDPEHEGVQFLARDAGGAAVGFASVFWSWDTTEGARVGIMNDLYVAPAARGTGLADALIDACARACGARGARRLDWQTAPGNQRAQAVYVRVGATREPWVQFSLGVRSGEP